MKLSIEDPCHENWDAMTPNEQGSFCLSCQKTVIDFSARSLGEIKSFFKELPLTEKVCGRFENTQLEEITFDHFFKRFKKWHLGHKIAVVCFFVFGLSLFSCASGNDKTGGADAIRFDTGRVQNTPVDTPSVTEPPVMGQVALPPDTLKKKAPIKKAPVKPAPQVMLKGDVSVEPEPVMMKGKVSVSPQKPVIYAPKDSINPAVKMGGVKRLK